MKIKLLFFIFFSSFFTYSQTDSLLVYIQNYKDTTEVFIKNGRSLVLESFTKNDYSSMKDLKNTMEYSLKHNSDYLVFYPLEKILINYWTKDYEPIPYDVFEFFSFTNAYYKSKKLPQNDLLFNKLYARTFDSKYALMDSVEKSFNRNIDKDFLKLTLHRLFQNENDTINQDFINQKSDIFLTKYPQSEYDSLVRAYYRYKLVESKWGYGIEFLLGYGVFNHGISEQFKNPISFGLGFDVSYNKLFFATRGLIAISKNQQDFVQNSVVWQKGKQANIILVDLSLGHTIHETKHFRIIPYGGITFLGANPVENDIKDQPELEDVEIKVTTGFNLGIGWDFKFPNTSSYNFFTNKSQITHSTLRLRYSYNFLNVDNKYSGLDGNFHSITIAYGGHTKTKNRMF